MNKPQFTQDDYLEIFESIKIKYSLNARISFIKNSENELGVKFADAICSIFEKCLCNNDNHCISFLKKNILSKGVSTGIGIKGINKILYPVNRSYGNDNLRTEENEFINHLTKILG